MHEMSLVSSIFSVLNDKIKEHDIKKVMMVKLIAGELTGVEDTTMKACFEIFAENTPVEGASLIIERLPVKARCRECKSEYNVKIPCFKCPYCGNESINIISGQELYIDCIEAE